MLPQLKLSHDSDSGSSLTIRYHQPSEPAAFLSVNTRHVQSLSPLSKYICKYEIIIFQSTDELLSVVRIVSVVQFTEHLCHRWRSQIRLIDWAPFTQFEEPFNFKIYLKNRSILWLKFKGFVFVLLILYETIIFLKVTNLVSANLNKIFISWHN